jgi:hypothetical protein
MALSSLGPASKWREFSGSHVVIEEMAKKLSGQSCINRGEILAHRHSRAISVPAHPDPFANPPRS